MRACAGHGMHQHGTLRPVIIPDNQAFNVSLDTVFQRFECPQLYSACKPAGGPFFRMVFCLCWRYGLADCAGECIRPAQVF